MQGSTNIGACCHTYSVTVPTSGWSSSPYTITLTCPGITANHQLMVWLNTDGLSDSARVAAEDAFSRFIDVEPLNASIKITSESIPSSALTINMKGV